MDDKELEKRAVAFRSRVEKAFKELGITGDYYCDPQRERWLDELSQAFIDDALGHRAPRLHQMKTPVSKG